MLKPEISVPAGVATSMVVYSIFQQGTPSIADIRSLPPGNADVHRSERQASWISAGVVGAISLVAKDPVILWFGSIAIVGMAWWTRHANQVVPSLGVPSTPTERAVAGSVTTGPAMMATTTAVTPSAPVADQFLS